MNTSMEQLKFRFWNMPPFISWTNSTGTKKFIIFCERLTATNILYANKQRRSISSAIRRTATNLYQSYIQECVTHGCSKIM